MTRRDILGQTSALGSTLLIGPPPANEARKLKVIVTGGHPGDPEYGCGGTISRLTDLGHEVVLLYLNNGEPAGKPGTGAIRTVEAKKACEILKARPLFAGQIDGDAIVDRVHAEQFRKIVESEEPDVIFTHWPIDNHADHRAISMLVYEAWLKLGKKSALYYYEVSNGEDTVHFQPTSYADITKTVETKKKACFAHASQAPEKFYAMQEQVTKFRGIERGCRQAEGFIRHVQSPEIMLPILM
jgi:LmbE family N-acetylglucosaminyl deacetylase